MKQVKPIPDLRVETGGIYVKHTMRFFRHGKECTLAELFPRPASGIIRLFGVSGGKDSDALALWALFESGFPKDEIIFTFADTDNEHDHTYAQIMKLSELHPVIWLVPELGFWLLVMWKKLFPSRKRRFCTQFLKQQPAQRFAHALVNAGYKVEMYTGVRAAESKERSVLPESQFDDYYALTVHRPLLRWTFKDVLAIHERYNFPMNLLYALGVRRVGCFPCINSVKSELRVVSEHSPATVNKIRGAENKLTKMGHRFIFPREHGAEAIPDEGIQDERRIGENDLLH